ncbi:MAG: lipopolysaccharide transport periplasmic protein LptA [Desulfamplus sp.]|nr:lipopolysaccharide transport periplasmic protein LptA [Desulfamplus sp.]
MLNIKQLSTIKQLSDIQKILNTVHLPHIFNLYIFTAVITFTFLMMPYFVLPVQAENDKNNKTTSDKELKLHVTSDSMLVEKDSSIITFSGNVVATQGDSVIKADKISVFLFTDKEKTAYSAKTNSTDTKQNIKSMTASGNVKLSSGTNRTAFADQAVYTAIDEKIILTGDAPRVMTGESYVTGKKITLFQNSGKVIVEGGKEKRVEALFNSKEDFNQDN